MQVGQAKCYSHTGTHGPDVEAFTAGKWNLLVQTAPSMLFYPLVVADLIQWPIPGIVCMFFYTDDVM